MGRLAEGKHRWISHKELCCGPQIRPIVPANCLVLENKALCVEHSSLFHQPRSHEKPELVSKDCLLQI